MEPQQIYVKKRNSEPFAQKNPYQIKNYSSPIYITKNTIYPPKNNIFIKPQPKKALKFRYIDEDGNKISAGGITFYEEKDGVKGIWLTKEEDNDKIVYTDFGGKYDYNDGDIFATIAREFREETYNTCEISYKQLKNTPKDKFVYIDGYDKTPVYVSIVDKLENYDIVFDSEKVKEQRKKILKSNPTIPEKWYKTLDVEFVTFEDIKGGKKLLSDRFKTVLKNICNCPQNYNEDIARFFHKLF